jgi:thiol-disulfide isomerase/thioredoxin
MYRSFAGVACTLIVVLSEAVAAAQEANVSVAQVLAFKPRRTGTEIETPAEADVAKCRVEAERRGKSTGWVLFGPQGQVLRRFMDTNGDDEVDEFRYFNHGMEVYRELDANGNKKPDQFRWLGSAGTRWATDANEDGRVDRWLLLSPEEATLEAIRAMVARDAVALQSLLVSAEDLRALGVSDKVSEKLLANVQDVAGKMKTAVGTSKVIQPATEWERFDCSMRLPSLLGAAPGKWDNDVYVYENVMAMVMNGKEAGIVQIGELVRVGDVWKLTRIPQPVEGDDLQVEAGVLLQESLDAGTLSPGDGLSPEGQQLVEQLKVLDNAAPGPDADAKAIENYNVRRADLVLKLARTVTSESERELWWRQLIEGVAAETHRGMMPNGVERLTAFEAEVRKDPKLEKLVPFTRFRKLLVEYAVKMQAATDRAAQQKVQEENLQALRDFVEEFRKSEEAPEAMWQVATTIEFNNNLVDSEKWYSLLAKEYPDAMAGKRAAGAVRRLNLKGKDLVLSGPALGGNGTVDLAQYKGRVVAVVFWTTWFKPILDEMPQLAELYKAHQKQGFEIIGVNLDADGTPVADAVKQHGMSWRQIQDPGGLETGKISINYGLIAPGAIFLIGKDGKVISNSASLEDLKKLVPDILKQ